MSVVTTLRQEIRELETLRDITNTLMDINSIKIKKIRASFEKNRRYYEEIAGVYHLINQTAMKNFGANLSQKSKYLKKTLSVALTSNYHFYGLLNVNVMKQFEEQTVGAQSDLTVIGKTGIAWSLSRPALREASPLRFNKDYPTPAEIGSFIKMTETYERVLIFYPQFETVASQVSKVFDITQRITGSGAESEKKPNIIFEPEIEKISDFFEKQVRTILFQKILLETELSRTAARLMTTAAATEKNEDFLKIRKSFLTKAVRAAQNARLLETFSTMGS